MTNFSLLTIDTTTLTIMMLLAVVRIYLEIIGFKWSALPISRMMGEQRIHRFHRYGLYVSIGFVVLFAPELLFYR